MIWKLLLRSQAGQEFITDQIGLTPLVKHIRGLTSLYVKVLTTRHNTTILISSMYFHHYGWTLRKKSKRVCIRLISCLKNSKNWETYVSSRSLTTMKTIDWICRYGNWPVVFTKAFGSASQNFVKHEKLPSVTAHLAPRNSRFVKMFSKRTWRD